MVVYEGCILRRWFSPGALKDRRENMGKLTITLVLLLLVAAAGGAAFLATWEIPPPISNVEKVLPNDKFPK